jgi:hypothetical protein
VAFFEEL